MKLDVQSLNERKRNALPERLIVGGVATLYVV
jgi:hypothetical protein